MFRWYGSFWNLNDALRRFNDAEEDYRNKKNDVNRENLRKRCKELNTIAMWFKDKKYSNSIEESLMYGQEIMW